MLRATIGPTSSALCSSSSSAPAILSRLPNASGSFAVPFVTYGGVNSGRALCDMAKIMLSKGLRVLGGIKVLAVHSLLWRLDDPVGKGHPDADDEARIREFVRLILKKLETGKAESLPLEALDDDPLVAAQTRFDGTGRSVPKSA